MARSDVFRPLRYCGQNSIVIYLAFFLPMAATRIALLKTGIITDLGTISLLVTAVLASSAAPAARRGLPAAPLSARIRNLQHAVDTRVAKFSVADGPHSGHASQTQISCRQARGRKARRRQIGGRQDLPRRRVAQKGRPRLPGRRLGLHLPRLSRAAAAHPQVGRAADQRRARLLQHAVEAAERHEAGGAADPPRRGVRQVGKDLPHRFLSRIQGAAAGRARPT